MHQLPDRGINEKSLVTLPVKVVGDFLHSIFANDCLPPAIRLYATFPLHSEVPAVPHRNKFTLHAVHNFIPLQMLQLIVTVFDGVPNSFQIFQCTQNTTEQQLDIFFDRAFHWNDLRYLLLGVNYLHNELQEVSYFHNDYKCLIIYYENRCLLRSAVIGGWNLHVLFILLNFLSLC